jgi:hypothetical protein
MLSSCAKLEPPFVSGGLWTGFAVADWLEVPPVEGTVPGLFFLMGGSRFFLNGGRVTVVDSSLAASGRVAEVAALVDDSASSVATTSTFSSGSGDKASSLGRFDPTDWLRSRALVGGGLRPTGVEAPSSLSTWVFTLGVALRFDLVSARGGDGS